MLFVGLAIFLSMGCITKQVWTDRVGAEPYQERIISFYNSEKDGKIVFIGEKYHYIFDKGTKDFLAFLEAKKRLKLKEESKGIRATLPQVDKQNIRVVLSFEFKKNTLTKEQEKWIVKDKNVAFIGGGGVDGNKTDIYGYVLNYNLLGKRYKATTQINSKVVKLKNPINIEVVEFKVKDKKSTLYKVAMTPLAVTADAGLIIVGTGVAIVLSPFALGYLAYDAITN